MSIPLVERARAGVGVWIFWRRCVLGYSICDVDGSCWGLVVARLGYVLYSSFSRNMVVVMVVFVWWVGLGFWGLVLEPVQ
jgi:hypothetical protein